MKKKIITLMTVGCLLSSLAHAIDESGGTRGGEVIKKDGQWVLRDRIDDTTYRCYTGKNTLAQDQAMVDEWNVMIKGLDQVNWYLGRAYLKEIDNVYFCFGKSDLVKVDTEDRDSLTAYYFSERNEAKMVAVRRDNAIRVVKDMFDGLSASDKAQLIVHELTHSFIKRSHRSYNDSVRSFSNAVATNSINPWNPEDFAIQMKEGGIEISNNYVVLTRYKEDIKKVLDTDAPLVERIKALQSAKKVVGELVAADRAIYLDLMNNANDFLKKAILTKDLDAVRALIRMGANPQAIGGLELAYEAESVEIFTALIDSELVKLSGSLLDTILKSNDIKYVEALFVGGYQFSLADELLEKVVKLSNRELIDYVMASPVIEDLYPIEKLFDLCLPVFDPQNRDPQAALIEMTNLNESPIYELSEIYSYALGHSFGTVIKTIIEKDSSFINLQNEKENTALDVAIVGDNFELFKFLVNHQAIDLNRTRFYGNSYLHTAVIYDRYQMVEYIMQNKLIDADVKNGAGLTPYKVASSYKMKSMKKLLKKYRK